MTTKAESNVRGEEVVYEAGNTTLKGYIAWDASKPGLHPGVLIVHEWWGHNDYVRRRADMLAELGYVAFALDMFGNGKNTTRSAEAQAFVQEAVGNPDVAKARFLAAYELLKAHEASDPERIAAIGYCFGGAVVLQMARFGADLAGVASFHGTLSTSSPAQPGTVTAKVLVLNGADDLLVPRDQVAAFKREMETAGVAYTFVDYQGAKHAFTNPAATERGRESGLPLAYDREADQQSWAELQRFFAQIFG